MADDVDMPYTGEALGAGNPLVYSSPLIQERRRRILKEARRLIAEKGLTNFGVRELAQRADVAQRTLYNAFSSKERIAALAIKEAFEEIRYHVNYRTVATTVEGMIDRAIAINTRNLKARNYALTVASIYFSPTTPRDVWEVLNTIGTGGMRELLAAVKARGDLEEWVIIDDVAGNFSNMTFAIINEWCMGVLSDDEYLRRIVESLLLLLLGTTHGATRASAERYQRDIRATGALPTMPRPTWRATPLAAG